MQGYGRGARMKIEPDRVEWLSGVRAGETLGSPDRDADREPRLGQLGRGHGAEGEPGETRRRRVLRPRPGHADLAGVLKYDRRDARDILERACARETAARVAAGAVAAACSRSSASRSASHVVSLGGVDGRRPPTLPLPLNAASDRSAAAGARPGRRAAHGRAHRRAKKDGDTLGGVVEVVVRGPGGRPGQPRELGSQARRPAGRRADVHSRGEGRRDRPGLRGAPGGRAPQVHDAIDAEAEPGAALADSDAAASPRRTNRAGGLEGGMTTGDPLVVRAGDEAHLHADVAPASSRPGDGAARPQAQSERSDVTAVPALGVIAEAVVALVLARRDAREVRRRLAGRDAAQLRRIPRAPRGPRAALGPGAGGEEE